MKNVTVVITGISHSGFVSAKSIERYNVNPEKSDIDIVKDAVDELDITGNGLRNIFNIQLMVNYIK
jgi:hypothetical protein